MIQIIGPQLTQWDVGRSVSVSNSDATHVHFANQGDSKAVIMQIENGTAKIPEYLLQTGKALLAYAVLNGVTLESKTFSVCKRAKPTNYVYEDDERNYIYELLTNSLAATAAANQAAENANNAAKNANQAAQTVKDFNIRTSNVTLFASAWVGSGSIYSQIVSINGITKYSRVDLDPSAEQVSAFYEKSVAFVTENENGVVTVYAIGQKPQNDYTMQVTVTEVNV